MNLLLSKLDLENINKEAAELYKNSSDDGFHRSGIWKRNSRGLLSVMNSKMSPIDKISKILDGHPFSSGVDVKYPSVDNSDNQVTKAEVEWSIEYVKSTYGVDVWEDTDLRESSFWREGKSVTIDGNRFSSDFCRHLFCFLEIQKYCESVTKVVELGSGIGNLARIFKMKQPKTQYFFIDIPESLYYGFMFMRLNFPDCSYKVVLDEETSSFEGFDFVFVPTKYVKVLYNQYFDLLINECSLGEMNQSMIEYWFDFIQDKIDVKYFYSFNRVLGKEREVSDIGDCFVGYDEKWKTLCLDTDPAFNKIPKHPRGKYLTKTWNFEKIVERLGLLSKVI